MTESNNSIANDGMIREVITEFINVERNVRKKGYDSVYESSEALLEQLQKELIARIKEKDATTKHGMISATWLIGDRHD